LPAGVRDVRYHRWQPSSDLSFFTGYVKLGGPRDDLVSIPPQLGLHRLGEEGALPYLPTSWATQPQVTLDWWDAGPETPPESWAGPFGVSGTIVAKLEDGRLYAIVTDTGRAEERA
jgi:hypothetical protein